MIEFSKYAKELSDIYEVCADAGIAHNPGETALEMVRNLATVAALVPLYRDKAARLEEQLQRFIAAQARRHADYHLDSQPPDSSTIRDGEDYGGA